MGHRREVSGVRRNGEEFPCEASIAKLGEPGRRLFAVVLRDVTDRKRSERNERFLSEGAEVAPALIESLLTRTDLRVAPRIMMGTDLWLEAIARDAMARNAATPQIVHIVAVGELAERRYGAAASLFGTMADAGVADARPYVEMATRLGRTAGVNSKGD